MQYERRYAPLVLLALGFGLFVGVIIMAGLNAPPAQVGSLDGGVPNPPPGGIIEATPMPAVPLPVFKGEMTVIEPAQTVAPQMDLRAYEKAIWQEVNRRREMNGLPALMWDERIASAARFHSSDMSQRNYFEHADPEGVRAGQRLTDAGVMYSRWAENILQPGGPFKVMADVDWWMGSLGHRATILGQYHLTGVGIAVDDRGQVYITQNFIS